MATNDSDVDDGAPDLCPQIGAVAGLTINTDGSYSFDAANAAYQGLAQGETVDVVAGYSVTDQHSASSTSTLTITLTGSNDTRRSALPMTARPLAEDATSPALTDSGTITFDDLDLGDVHSASVAADPGNTLGGILTAVVSDAASGAGDGTVTWTYSVANGAAQSLAAEQTATEQFTVTIADGHGGSISQVITATVTGTNDAPVVEVANVTGAVTEALTPAGNLTDSGTIAFTDVDLTDVHSVGAVTPSAGALGSLVAA